MAVKRQLAYSRDVLDATQRDQVLQRIIDALHGARIRCGLSQNQLARRAGLSHTMVMRVEKRERIPRLDTLLRIAEALEIDLGALITNASKRHAPKGH